MNISQLRTELHEIINRVTDDKILEAVHTILSSRTANQPYMKERHLTKEAMDEKIEVSEQDIKLGKVTDHQVLKKEILDWRK